MFAIFCRPEIQERHDSGQAYGDVPGQHHRENDNR